MSPTAATILVYAVLMTVAGGVLVWMQPGQYSTYPAAIVEELHP